LRLALGIYWLNILVPGAILYLAWVYARRAGLLKDEAGPEVDHAIRRRILVAQALYAFGAAPCLISSGLSIAWIVLVQLNFATGPRIPFMRRIWPAEPSGRVVLPAADAVNQDPVAERLVQLDGKPRRRRANAIEGGTHRQRLDVERDDNLLLAISNDGWQQDVPDVASAGTRLLGDHDADDTGVRAWWWLVRVQVPDCRRGFARNGRGRRRLQQKAAAGQQ
jgi:hypothetical protein